MNYFQDNNKFLEPSVHHLGRDGTGKTVSDFPVLYYAVAQLWKIFGKHEFIARLVNLLIFYAGLSALFKTIEIILKDSFMAIFASALLFTSPILVYYANNFLMDVPAFSMGMIGLYFFTRFYFSPKNKFFLLFAACFALAGLLKISSMISFIALTFLFVREISGVKLRNRGKIFNHPLKQGLIMLSVYALLIAWYLYARNYNEKYNSGNFLLGILPVWKSDHKMLHNIMKALTENIKWAYFYRFTQLLLAFTLLYILINFRKTDRTLLMLTSLVSIGLLGFLILFFQALAHDYYVINMLILAPLVLLTFMFTLKTVHNKIYLSFIFRALLVAYLIHNIDFARRRINDRYNPDGWQNAYYTNNVRFYGEIKPYLRTLGIQTDDRVISLSDNSINVTLYLMNQKGWTNYGLNADSTLIRQKIAMGAKFLFISDKTLYENKSLDPFIKHKIGSFRTIDIFRL